MTVTYINDAGNWEHFDKTISARLSASWTSGNTNSETPTFHSASGTNVSQSWPRSFGTNEIHCNEDDTQFPISSETANGNTWQGMKSLVYIDIFARDANLLKLFIREVNRIIWELNPNSGNRVKKSNGTDNSPIDHFESYTIQFIKERQLAPNMRVSAHGSGTLKIIWYKLRS
jgi:hypothetical protein